MEAVGRTGPVMSDWSQNHRALRPMSSVWSGGVGLVCVMKRGIDITNCIGNIRWKVSAEKNRQRRLPILEQV